MHGGETSKYEDMTAGEVGHAAWASSVGGAPTSRWVVGPTATGSKSAIRHYIDPDAAALDWSNQFVPSCGVCGGGGRPLAHCVRHLFCLASPAPFQKTQELTTVQWHELVFMGSQWAAPGLCTCSGGLAPNCSAPGCTPYGTDDVKACEYHSISATTHFPGKCTGKMACGCRYADAQRRWRGTDGRPPAFAERFNEQASLAQP